MVDKTTECINGELKINDIVLVNSTEGRYGCLVGNVIAIDKHGSPDHDTGNPGDDIHVNFADSEYTNWRVLEIEKTFSDNSERKPLAEIALDDVIMSPESLINVTNIKHREFAEILSSFDNARIFCDAFLRDYFKDLNADSKADISDSPHRYMHVDLQDFLGKIAAEIIVNHPKDFDVDIETFREAAACDDFIDRRFAWLVSEKGTNTTLEFEAFQQGTDPYRYATESHSYSGITPYIVEVTGIDRDGKVIGNVFEAGEYREFAKHVRNNSVANDMIAIHYHDGEKNTMPRERYDQNPAKYNTMHGYPLPEFRYYPADEQAHLEFLQQERDTRMKLPIGVENQHIKKVAKRMAAINVNQEIAEKPQSKAVQKKPKIADKLEKAIEKSKSQTPKKSAKIKKKQEEL